MSPRALTTFVFEGERYCVLGGAIRVVPAALLTRAEQDVLRELLRGCSARQIAARRRTSPKTVEKQTESLLRKLGARSRAELVRESVRRSL